MADPPEKDETVGGLRVREDDPRFAEDELLTCGRCARANPPNRADCFYCGAPLKEGDVPSGGMQLSFRRPETWEHGFSVVTSCREIGTDVNAGAVCESLGITAETFRRLTTLHSAVPLAYLRSLTEADILASRLAELRLPCCVAGDDLLTADVAPTRLRRINFEKDGVNLVDFNTGKIRSVGVREAVLIVSGVIVRRYASTSGRRRRGKTRQLEETETFSDEPVLDIYPPSDVFGYRIRAAGFDFSCLGDRMSMTAGDNLTALIAALCEKLPSSTHISEYAATMPVIDAVWPPSESRESGTVARRTFGGIGVERTAVLDNTTQFTKFSRLQRHFR